MVSRRGRPRKGDEKHAVTKEETWESVMEGKDGSI